MVLAEASINNVLNIELVIAFTPLNDLTFSLCLIEEGAWGHIYWELENQRALLI